MKHKPIIPWGTRGESSFYSLLSRYKSLSCASLSDAHTHSWPRGVLPHSGMASEETSTCLPSLLPTTSSGDWRRNGLVCPSPSPITGLGKDPDGSEAACHRASCVHSWCSPTMWPGAELAWAHSVLEHGSLGSLRAHSTTWHKLVSNYSTELSSVAFTMRLWLTLHCRFPRTRSSPARARSYAFNCSRSLCNESNLYIHSPASVPHMLWAQGPFKHFAACHLHHEVLSAQSGFSDFGWCHHKISPLPFKPCYKSILVSSLLLKSLCVRLPLLVHLRVLFKPLSSPLPCCPAQGMSALNPTAFPPQGASLADLLTTIRQH